MNEPTPIAGTEASRRRFLRGLANEMSKATTIARILRYKSVTREQEIEWRRFESGPLGDPRGIYAVIDGDHALYFDECDNPLDVTWVLARLRGTDEPRAMTEDQVREHPWMQARG